MALRQEVNTPLILTVGAVSGLVLLVTVFGLDAWFRYEQDREIEQKWSQARNVLLESTQKAQFATIQRSGIDQDRKTYTIPIADAMKKIIETGGKLPATRPATTQATK